MNAACMYSASTSRSTTAKAANVHSRTPRRPNIAHQACTQMTSTMAAQRMGTQYARTRVRASTMPRKPWRSWVIARPRMIEMRTERCANASIDRRLRLEGARVLRSDQQRDGHLVQRRRDSVRSSQPDDRAVACIDLHGTTGHAIGDERVERVGRRLPGSLHHRLDDRVVELGPFGATHGDALAHDPPRELGNRIDLNDARRLHEDGRDRTWCVDAQLRPRTRLEVAGGDVEVRLREQGDERTSMRGVGHHDPRRTTLAHPPGCGALGGAVDDRWYESLLRDEWRESLDVLDAILQDDDRRALVADGREPARSARRVVGLRGDEHPVDRLRIGRIGHDAWRDGEAPRRRVHLQSIERRS